MSLLGLGSRLPICDTHTHTHTKVHSIRLHTHAWLLIWHTDTQNNNQKHIHSAPCVIINCTSIIQLCFHYNFTTDKQWQYMYSWGIIICKLLHVLMDWFDSLRPPPPSSSLSLPLLLPSLPPPPSLNRITTDYSLCSVSCHWPSHN